jgi:hypothetical protein
MRLPTASLAIGKYGAIISKQDILDKAICSFGVDKLLRRLLVKDMVKGEGFSIVGIVEFNEANLIILLIGLDD